MHCVSITDNILKIKIIKNKGVVIIIFNFMGSILLIKI
jgi:hypothetical protein